MAEVLREQLHLTGTKIGCGQGQCGCCMPGVVVSAKALLGENPNPSRQDVRAWFQANHNACRCNGYKPIVDAVMDAAKVLRGEMPRETLEFAMPADGRIWRTSYPRPSAVAKVHARSLSRRPPGDGREGQDAALGA